MDQNIGLWIDHKQAFLIWLDRNKVEVIPSNLEPRTHSSGSARIGGRYNQNLDSELKHDDRYNIQLSRYYEHVIKTIQNADSIFIMGPGEAKLELKNAIKRRKDIIKNLMKIETADKMTRNQMVAYVREIFSKSSKG